MVIQEEQDAIYGYTVSYHNINEPLRGLTYYGSQTSAQLGLQRIPLIEGIINIINKSSYNFDMWLQRGDKLVALKKFGLANFSTATDEEIKALIGATGTEGAFIKQQTFGSESEMLLQRGTTFKITKVEKSNGTWYIDLDIVAQNPLPFPFPYVGGYPYK